MNKVWIEEGLGGFRKKNKIWIEKGLGRFRKKNMIRINKGLGMFRKGIRSGILEKLIKEDVKEWLVWNWRKTNNKMGGEEHRCFWYTK